MQEDVKIIAEIMSLIEPTQQHAENAVISYQHPYYIATKISDNWKDADPGIAKAEDAKKRLAGIKSQIP